MRADQGMVRARGGLKLAGVIALSVLGIGCVWLTAEHSPDWVDGSSAQYPSARYLTGVGQADSRTAAVDQAYAAVARIFRAEVEAQAKDWESYLVIEQRGSSNTERRLTLDQVTKVTTDKMLENVMIADVWHDLRRGLYYAIAVMNRAQAEASLMERLLLLDRAIEADVAESRHTTDKLVRVRNLRRAAKTLVLREGYNADLRVIRSSGQGTSAVYRVDELTAELEHFLATNLIMTVRVTGDHVEPVRRALTEGLLREGLRVVLEPEDDLTAMPELLVRGMVRVFPVEVKDPQFTYVRWCSDFDVVDTAGGQVVGAVARGGREGHLTEREATAKVLRVMHRELSVDVAAAIAAHLFGEATLPMPGVSLSGCPRKETASQSTR